MAENEKSELDNELEENENLEEQTELDVPT
jgi:hypothetical protein